MKSCPKCKRTYADDGFTFCLEDGALLSAPYDSEKSEPVSTIRSDGPPPTAVIPTIETGGQELPPTVMGTPSPRDIEETERYMRVQSEKPPRTSRVKHIAIGLVALVAVVSGLGFLGLYVVSGSNCPRLIVNCFPSGTSTYCDLAEDKSHTFNDTEGKRVSAALCSRSIFLLQAAALPEGITNVSWSTSSGAIRSNHSQLVIDTTGLAGKTIEVKANVTSSSWFCSTTVSASFDVPSELGKPAK